VLEPRWGHVPCFGTVVLDKGVSLLLRVVGVIGLIATAAAAAAAAARTGKGQNIFQAHLAQKIATVRVVAWTTGSAVNTIVTKRIRVRVQHVPQSRTSPIRACFLINQASGSSCVESRNSVDYWLVV
jgi:hypothetical protein